MATSAPSLGGLANERLNASVMSLGRLSMPAPAGFEPSISALFDGTTDPRLAHSNYTGAARPPAAMSTTLPPGPANPFLAGTLAHVPKTANALLTAGGSATIHHGYVPGQQVEAAHNLCIRVEGEVAAVVQTGDRGVILGQATTGDAGRVAVLFDVYPDEPLNVVPAEVRVGTDPFDAESHSIEVQLAKMLWEGRDPFAGAQAPGLPQAGDMSLPGGASSGVSPQPYAAGGGLPAESSVSFAPNGAMAGLRIGPMTQVPPNRAQFKKPVNPRYRARLLRFFERYNPHRLPSVPGMLQEYAGCEEALMQSLIKKYGPEPPETDKELPPGWSQVQSSKGHVFYRHVTGTRQWARPEY